MAEASPTPKPPEYLADAFVTTAWDVPSPDDGDHSTSTDHLLAGWHQLSKSADRRRWSAANAVNRWTCMASLDLPLSPRPAIPTSGSTAHCSGLRGQPP